MKSCKVYNFFDEIPAFNFLKFLESPDVKYLFHETESEFTNEDLKNAFESWNNIFQEYIDFVGLGDKTLMIMRQEDKIIKLKIDYYTKGKKHLSAVIAAEERKLKELTKGADEKQDNMYNETAFISKYMGFHVKIKEISAKEYFAFAKNMKNG